MNKTTSSRGDITISQEILDDAQIIWDYQAIYEKPEPADFIIATGHEFRLVDEAIRLFNAGYAQYFIASGGHLYGKVRGFKSKDNNKTEAKVFEERALEMGIPKNKIFVQDKSKNIGEVLRFTKEIFEKEGISIKKGIFIYEPDKQRRGKASLEKQWPEIESIVTSIQITMQEYANDELPMSKLIKQIIANMTKIIEYPKLGFQKEQDIPKGVMEAYNRLLLLNF